MIEIQGRTIKIKGMKIIKVPEGKKLVIENHNGKSKFSFIDDNKICYEIINY